MKPVVEALLLGAVAGQAAHGGQRPCGRLARPRCDRAGHEGRPQSHRPAALRLDAPAMRADLPAGGKRLLQSASGYVVTLVAGKVISRDGVATGALPGVVVRGPQRTAPGFQ